MLSLKIAVQKSGRLTDDSLDLLRRAGLAFDSPKGRLFVPCDSFPSALMMIRDDDIPGCVSSGACDAGIVGLNVFREYQLKLPNRGNLNLQKNLVFGRCRLSLAVPETFLWNGIKSLSGLTIATSYPAILSDYLSQKKIQANVVPMSGSLEIAPRLGISDAICDVVSSGATLRANGLCEVEKIMESAAVLIVKNELDMEKTKISDRLTQRIDGVLKARGSRYIMMNARKSDVTRIRELLPGLWAPTIMPLAGDEDRVAIHAATTEVIFWDTLERLRDQGARDILVLPIEKIME